MLYPLAPVELLHPSLHRALMGSDLPLRAEPDRDNPEWHRTDSLLRSGRWAQMGRVYADRIGTRHLAPGLICAFQRYASRVIQPPVVAWFADGCVLDMRHEQWWARIDPGARTTVVASPGMDVCANYADATQLAEALHAHLDPLIGAVYSAGNVTLRAATGAAATAVARAFGVVFRGVEEPRRPEVVTVARTVLATFETPARSRAGLLPTVSLVQLDDPVALTFDRHTCCLIRLGSHQPCSTCPTLDPAERLRRQTNTQRRTKAHIDLSRQ